MAEFDYFCTKDEFVGFLHTALSDGYVVHVNKNLVVPVSAICSTAKEIEAAVSHGQHAFFLERSDITRYGVQLAIVDQAGSRFWYPRTRVGGPVIEAFFWAPFEKDGSRIVPCSLFTYHSSVINPDGGHVERAGERIKEAFSLLIGPLRKRSRRVKSVKRSAFVSLGADTMLAEGWVLAPPFSKPEGKTPQEK